MASFNLPVLLAERMLKITDVSVGSEVSRTTLTAIYYNKAKGIQLGTIQKLCDYLKCEVSDLIKLEDGKI